MKQLKHILSALMLMTMISAMAGIPHKKSQTDFAKHGEILSKEMVFDKSKMKNFHFSTDEITDKMQREAMRDEIRKKSGTTSQKNSPRKTNEKLYTVKCVFKGEDMPYFAIYNPDFFEESIMEIWFESGETDTYYFQVPAGTYDVNAQYYSYAEGMTGFAYLVRENIEVNGNTTVEFSPDMLTEKVVIKPYLKDGKEALLPIYTIEENSLDESNATASFSNLDYAFLREGCDLLATGFSIADCTIKGEEQTFLSNRLSDKYHLVFKYFIANKNGEFEITTTDMTGAESGTIKNYTKNFVKYEAPIFGKTPAYKEFGEIPLKSAIQGLLWLDNVETGRGGMYIDSLNPDIYVASQQGNDVLNIKTPVRMTNIQGEKTITWEEDWDGEIHKFSEKVRAEIITLPALYNGEEWEYINQNHAECGNFSYQCPEDGPIVEYPGVPSYCYFADQITQPIGNSSPVLALMTQVNAYPDFTIFRFDPQAYIGRYGEVRTCDYWNLRTVVNLDGKTVFDNINSDNLDNWCIENSTDNHEKGTIEATFTNRNVLVDETITGFNITSIKVDERNEDLCTPTTQMLIFKNTDGVITDRFQTGEDGIIEFSAGDFNWVETEDKHFYVCDEAEVKVEYAPYGEDAFLPLEVEEIPENYYMPGFGYFYRGSLADVSIPSSNGWYDIRFTLTDKAGNEMVQHISPAFKIDKNVGVAEVAVNGTKVWAANGTVFAAGSDVAAMELFTADGKRIATSNGYSLSANGYRGIAIVKAIAADGSASTHKVAIK